MSDTRNASAAAHETGKRQARIKTFARRESRITPAQQKALAELLGLYQIPWTNKKIDISEVFPKAKKFAVEIGFGDGSALLEQAMRNTETAYLGIEVFRPGVGKCLIQLQRNNITNVRISTADARDVISEQISSASVHEFIMLFPDPWPKMRHRKRRLVNPEFIALCVDRLVPGGTITIVTDSVDYAQQVIDVLEDNDGLESLAHHLASSERRSPTRYEKKAIAAGHSVFEMQYAKSVHQPVLNC